MPYIKQYLDESPGRPLQSIWIDVPMSKSGFERTGYATQKPEALLERIVNVSSNEHDLVLDCFCGSGTTAAVAERLNRRWIACDLGRFAIHTTRKRLLGIPGVKPFVVQNLGKYERQAWQVAEFATSRVGADAHVRPAERSSAATVRGENPSQGQVALPADKGSLRLQKPISKRIGFLRSG